MAAAAAEVQLSDFPSLFSLEGKVAVVTGGSRGLGLHAASGLLQAGCSKVYITSRKASACAEAVAALNALPNLRPGAKAISVPADASNVKEIERLVQEVGKTTDRVDILFANAGATWGAPFDEHTGESFSKVMDLNVKSVFFTVQKYVFPPQLESLSPSFLPYLPVQLTDISNEKQIYTAPDGARDARLARTRHRHGVGRGNRHRLDGHVVGAVVHGVQGRRHPPDQAPRRRPRPAAHPVQRHRPGLLPDPHGQRADGDSGRAGGAG